MKRTLPLILLVFCLSSCEKQPEEIQKYDLFPLNVGNEYYYSYNSYQADIGAGSKEEKSNIRWIILRKSENETATRYTIEETKYNRSCYSNYFNSPDTTYIENETSYFTIIESATASWLTFSPMNWGPFPRYSEIRDTIFESGYPVYGSNYRTWHFIADSGLVHFGFRSGSTHHPFGSGFSLDSLKNFQ